MQTYRYTRYDAPPRDNLGGAFVLDVRSRPRSKTLRCGPHIKKTPFQPQVTPFVGGLMLVSGRSGWRMVLDEEG